MAVVEHMNVVQTLRMLLKKFKMELMEKENLRFEDVDIIKNIIEDVETRELLSTKSKNSKHHHARAALGKARRKKSNSDILVNKYKTSVITKGKGIHRSLENYLTTTTTEKNHKFTSKDVGSFGSVVRSEGNLYFDVYENAESEENADANSVRSLRDVRTKISSDKSGKKIKYSIVDVDENHMNVELARHRESIKKSVKQVRCINILISTRVQKLRAIICTHFGFKI